MKSKEPPFVWEGGLQSFEARGYSRALTADQFTTFHQAAM
jgi:hypothetical protein